MIFLIYACITLLLLFFAYREWQYHALFHPKFYRDDSFDERFKPLFIRAEDGVKLEGAVFSPKEPKGRILYFGGRGQDSVGLLPKLARCYLDVQIISFNYRGYGKSEGKISEQALLQDALLVYEKVVKNFGGCDLVGYSFGCSVASYVAGHKDVQKLFLIAPFASIETFIKDRYRFTLPFLRYSFDTCAYLQQSNAKISLFASEDDEIVPFENTKRLKKCVLDFEHYIVLQESRHVEMLCERRVTEVIHSSISTPSQNSS